MKIKVEYTSQIKQVVGVAEETFELEIPCTAAELTQRVVEKHGEPLRRILLDEQNRPSPTILVFVDGDLIRGQTPRELRDRDVVTYMTPISGG